MTEYTPAQAFAAWQAGDVTIVDVREQREHDTTRVEGVTLIPMSELPGRVEDFPTGTPLVILCRSGNRSGQVAEFLNTDGRWGDVANLTGGILAWASDGLPYEGDPPT